jgi:uncharacterized phage protein gp47/JayE
MTFVAQPYEQFVDDLLTALTGGLIREEHQFVGSEQPYHLASPGAIPVSIKVFGQRNEAFVFFEGGIDYRYDLEQEAIIWKPDGKLPDDHSFFYVNYYLQEGPRKLTDRNPGSVTTTLAEAFAREFAVLHKQMELIYRSPFADLATGVSLDHVAALLGLTRKDAKFASGEVLFKRSTPAPGDITIPAGALVSTDLGLNFETTDKRTLRKDQLSIAVPIRAQVEGPGGRVEAGAIKNINRPIFGIESVINEEATFFAATKETDEEFRRRIKGTLERAGKATLDAIKYHLIEELPEITESKIQVIEKPEVPGLVEVKLGLGSIEDANLVRRVEEAIFNSRAAGVRVVHNLPTRTKSESTQRAEAGQKPILREEVTTHFREKGDPRAVIHLPPEILDQMPEGLLPLRVEVLLRLTERNLSVAQKESIEDAVRMQVMDYLEALPMGADLIYNKLLGRIVQSEDILDAVLLIGTESGNEFYKSNLATDGRKAKIDMQNVFVGLMDEAVFIEVLVQLESKKNQDQRAEVTPALRTAITDAIHRVLVAARGKLLKTDIKTEVSAALEAVTPHLQLIASNALVLNAEYEETGRLLNNAEEISLEKYQVPELREPVIKIVGVLDG